MTDGLKALILSPYGYGWPLTSQWAEDDFEANPSQLNNLVH
jgi:hypothetical protein